MNSVAHHVAFPHGVSAFGNLRINAWLSFSLATILPQDLKDFVFTYGAGTAIQGVCQSRVSIVYGQDYEGI